MQNQNQNVQVAFDRDRAASYDKRNEKMAAMRDALYLLTKAILSDLPADAHILCVGAGTGTELLYLAQQFPGWRFTAVEPAGAMLEVCRRKAEDAGITARCTFYEGYLDSLPATAPFDGATCFLVSHFLLEPEKRSAFFGEIAARLRPGGLLVNADLASDRSTPSYARLLDVWITLLKSSDWPNDQVEKLREIYGRDVALLPLPEVESIIAAGGFESPVLFLQTGLIHGWFSRRAETV